MSDAFALLGSLNGKLRLVNEPPSCETTDPGDFTSHRLHAACYVRSLYLTPTLARRGRVRRLALLQLQSQLLYQKVLPYCYGYHAIIWRCALVIFDASARTQRARPSPGTATLTVPTTSSKVYMLNSGDVGLILRAYKYRRTTCLINEISVNRQCALRP